MKNLHELKWPRVSVEKGSDGLCRWRVEPMMPGSPCLNFGIEFSMDLAEQRAWNYTQFLLGEETPQHNAQEIDFLWATLSENDFFSSIGVTHVQ